MVAYIQRTEGVVPTAGIGLGKESLHVFAVKIHGVYGVVNTVIIIPSTVYYLYYSMFE